MLLLGGKGKDLPKDLTTNSKSRQVEDATRSYFKFHIPYYVVEESVTNKLVGIRHVLCLRKEGTFEM